MNGFDTLCCPACREEPAIEVMRQKENEYLYCARCEACQTCTGWYFTPEEAADRWNRLIEGGHE